MMTLINHCNYADIFIQLPRELSQKNLGANLSAERLDSLMVVMFEHLESCKSGGRLTEVSLILFVLNMFGVFSYL